MDASFKEELLSHLSDSGALHTLKERLRSEVSKSLIPSSEPSQIFKKPKKQLRRVLDALFEDYLDNSQYHYSLSVFQPESGSRGHSLSHRDVLKTLHIEPGSELYSALKRRGYGRQSHGAAKPGLATALLEAVMETSGTAKLNKHAAEDSSSFKRAEIRKLEQRQAELEARIRSIESDERLKTAASNNAAAVHHVAQTSGPKFSVQERLQQAAASSWVAQATDEPVWMAWAQQSDTLIDEVLAGCETMLQCVEDARLALAAAEQDAADLRGQLGHILLERRDLIAVLPDLAPVLAWGPGNVNPPATPISRAAVVLSAEQRIKEGVRSLQKKVLSHRQTATAHLAHSLACMGLKPPEASPGILHGPPAYDRS
ncbi:hypothetical protein WJX73_001514 [Symbiochloris irregularis]|uniref:LisH domain-containing protein n=1 Tax=Symbiochloris irregularis TaxID=706552 RepID=A0AAW1NU02_9CHLO